jgi:formamidopyrimidine-DNA glycosylase
MLEVESYRRLAERVIGRRILRVDAPDPWYLKDGLTADAVGRALVGRRLIGARRTGKQLFLETKGGPTVGIHFGMTGRLFVDADPGEVDGLIYGPSRTLPAWVRFGLALDDDRELEVIDARRLGAVTLDPDEDRLGPDAGVATRAQLAAILGRSRAPLKALLMDQARLAGLGNLLTDEALWRAGIHPARPAHDLSPAEVGRLHRAIRDTLRICGRRGGSHTGDLVPERRPGGIDPRTGVPLQRLTVGGRTTWYSPARQVLHPEQPDSEATAVAGTA